jgi:hypothetical protein
MSAGMMIAMVGTSVTTGEVAETNVSSAGTESGSL